jgi:hypothetical protein
MAWCEANKVDFLFGLARNSRLVDHIHGDFDGPSTRPNAPGGPPAASPTSAGAPAAAGPHGPQNCWSARLTEGRCPMRARGRDLSPRFGEGKVATFIPQLARVDPALFGMALVTVEGDVLGVGDADVPFSIQSISKVFLLALALGKHGEAPHVGREPSGSAFNSIMLLEHEHGPAGRPAARRAVVRAMAPSEHGRTPDAAALRPAAALAARTAAARSSTARRAPDHQPGHAGLP